MKLTKTQRAELVAHTTAMTVARGVVEDEMAALNEKIRALLDEFNGTVVETYNARVQDVTAWVEDQASEARATFDDRSENWQQSDRGQEVDEVISAWENATLEPMEPLSWECFDGGVEWADDVLEGLDTES